MVKLGGSHCGQYVPLHAGLNKECLEVVFLLYQVFEMVHVELAAT